MSTKEYEELYQEGPNDGMDYQAGKEKLKWMIHNILGNQPASIWNVGLKAFPRQTYDCEHQK